MIKKNLNEGEVWTRLAQKSEIVSSLELSLIGSKQTKGKYKNTFEVNTDPLTIAVASNYLAELKRKRLNPMLICPKLQNYHLWSSLDSSQEISNDRLIKAVVDDKIFINSLRHLGLLSNTEMAQVYPMAQKIAHYANIDGVALTECEGRLNAQMYVQETTFVKPPEFIQANIVSLMYSNLEAQKIANLFNNNQINLPLAFELQRDAIRVSKVFGGRAIVLNCKNIKGAKEDYDRILLDYEANMIPDDGFRVVLSDKAKKLRAKLKLPHISNS
jgi:CHAT domain-containing protein